MIRKTVGKKRVRAHVTRGGTATRHANCLLPDRAGIGYFKNSRRGIKKLSQISKVNMRPHMISPEIMHRIQRSQIDLTRNSLPSVDLQRWLTRFGAHRRNRLTFVSSYFKP